MGQSTTCDHHVLAKTIDSAFQNTGPGTQLKGRRWGTKLNSVLRDYGVDNDESLL